MQLYQSGNGSYSILCIHGFLENNSMWNFLNDFGVKKITFDIPGHGLEPLADYQNMADLASTIAEVLKKHGHSPDLIIGHSMGGYIAIELFKLLPNAEKLVLLNSNFWEDSEQKKVDRRRVADIVFEQKRLFLETAIPNLFSNRKSFSEEINELINEADNITPEAIATASLAMARRSDNTNYLRHEKRKIFIVQGEYDNIVSIDQMLSETEGWNIPILLPSGHMSHVETTTLLRDYLLEIIAT